MRIKSLACLAAAGLLTTATVAQAAADSARPAPVAERQGSDVEGERMSGFVLPWYFAVLIGAVAVAFIALDSGDEPASP